MSHNTSSRAETAAEFIAAFSGGTFRRGAIWPYGSDLMYLLQRRTTTDSTFSNPLWLAFVIRKFGQTVVTEAFRRMHGVVITRGYMYGVMRKVAAGS